MLAIDLDDEDSEEDEVTENILSRPKSFVSENASKGSDKINKQVIST